MLLHVPYWLEVPPADVLCSAQGVLLQGMVNAVDDNAEIYASLSAVNDMLGDFVGTIVDRQQYGIVLGSIFGRTHITADKKDILRAMVEINKAEQCAIRRRGIEYNRLVGVSTMLEEMLDYNLKGKGEGKGKGGVLMRWIGERRSFGSKPDVSTRERSRSPVPRE